MFRQRWAGGGCNPVHLCWFFANAQAAHGVPVEIHCGKLRRTLNTQLNIESALHAPVLALYGDRDRQAPPRENVPVLEAQWADHPDATIRVLPGLNHFFQHAETGLMAEIAQIDETLAPEALDAVATWITARFVKP